MNYTKGNWTIETHKDTKYPDIETYTILAPNPDAGKSGVCYSGSHLAVAQLDYLPDARLISAAPDMYEALQSVLLRLDMEAKEKGEDAIFPCAAMRSTIRQALNKATGGTK